MVQESCLDSKHCIFTHQSCRPFSPCGSLTKNVVNSQNAPSRLAFNLLPRTGSPAQSSLSLSCGDGNTLIRNYTNPSSSMDSKGRAEVLGPRTQQGQEYPNTHMEEGQMLENTLSCCQDTGNRKRMLGQSTSADCCTVAEKPSKRTAMCLRSGSHGKTGTSRQLRVKEHAEPGTLVPA